MSEELLVIFVRNPELGKVKTRLAKDVGDEAALAIYTFLLERTLSITLGLEQDKQVHYSDSITLNDLWPDFGYQKRKQTDGDLGEKMRSAFEQGFEAGFKRIVIIGSDLYDIESKDIQQAFDLLKRNEVVIGPAQDGGYYLLGMCSLIPGIFENKPWGTDRVLAKTQEELSGYSVKLLSERNDADYLSDIIDIPVFQPFLKHLKHD